MANYKGIEFAQGYNKPFADFKEEFEQTHIFKNIPSAEREKALKEAHKIATNGNISGTNSESKKAKSDKSE